MKVNTKTLTKILVAVTGLSIIGCAKEKPYDIKYKEVKELSRSQIVTEETVTMPDGTKVTKPVEYLYVPMTLGTPMNVVDADPFYQGDEKVVRLEWSEAGLEVLEMERDERFNDNNLNDLPVLSIPGDYVSYRCAEDAYGECTNKEEVNDELEWFQNSHFTPKFEDLKLREVNSLDIFTVSNGSCITASDAKVVDYEISNGVINVELEKTFKVNSTNFWCFFRSYIEENLSTNGFQVRYYYSLVRLDKLASPDYEPVVYPEPDHDSFGFFTREEKVLEDNFDRNRAKKDILMQRWNPRRKNNELVYHLSPEYSSPENKFILDATHEAIDSMNKEMTAANIPFTIKLIEQPDPKKAVSPGDLRYNSLVLITDPLANGLLGYGPSVGNPYTGEIVQAHTNMYLGVLKSMSRWVYEAAVDLTEEEWRENNAEAALATMAIDPSALGNLPAPLAKAHFPEVLNEELMAFLQANMPQPPAPAASNDDSDEQGEEDENNTPVGGSDVVVNTPPAVEEAEEDQARNALLHRHSHAKISQRKLESVSLARVNNLLKERLQSKKNQRVEEVMRRLKDEGKLTKADEAMMREQARLDRFAENNAFAVEFFPIGGTSKVVYPTLKQIPGAITAKGTLKRWDNLNKNQKNAVIEIITKNSYKATLVHELGHNLGLRHNFLGSWDKKNFYSDKEAQSLGLEAAPAYSSIMDYSFSEFNQLKALGKYDLAALRFGYAREIEVGKSDTVPNEEGNLEEVFNSQGFKKVVVEENIDEVLKDMTYQEQLAYLTGKPMQTFGSMSIKTQLEQLESAKKSYKPKMVSATVSQFEANLESQNLERRPYQFCTDENAGLSSTCNRFDEGTTLVEVTNHMIKRYKDYYKYRNYRDGRLDFSAYDIAGYVFGRKREFTNIRDVLEEYEFFVTIFGKDVMAGGCSPDQFNNPNTLNICTMIKERQDSVRLAGDFFMEILKTPDHLCALVKKEEPTLIVEYRKLSEIYDEIKFQQAQGYVPKSCFEAPIKATVAAEDLLVVGENGKYLNGFKDTDPNYKYVTDRAVLGIWPDKIMAVNALFRREWGKANTDRAHMALMDIPEIAEKVEPMLNHMILGKPIQEPIPFTMEDGRKFQTPYVLGNDYQIDQIEDAFSWLRYYLGLPSSGTGNLLSASLQQLRVGVDYGEEYRQDAFKTRNLTAVIKETRNLPLNQRAEGESYYYDAMTNTTFIGNENTPLASKMIFSLNNFDRLEKAGRMAAIQVIAQMRNPQAPADMPAPLKAYFGLDAEWQETLIGLKEGGRELPIGAFVQTFGQQEGPLIFATFQQDIAVMRAIVELKEQIRTTPPADATDEVKFLFEVPEEIVAEYAQGVLTAEVVEYYKGQLRKLPTYQYFPWN